jgi:hypothetical protein
MTTIVKRPLIQAREMHFALFLNLFVGVGVGLEALGEVSAGFNTPLRLSHPNFTPNFEHGRPHAIPKFWQSATKGVPGAPPMIGNFYSFVGTYPPASSSIRNPPNPRKMLDLFSGVTVGIYTVFVTVAKASTMDAGSSLGSEPQLMYSSLSISVSRSIPRCSGKSFPEFPQ